MEPIEKKYVFSSRKCQPSLFLRQISKLFLMCPSNLTIQLIFIAPRNTFTKQILGPVEIFSFKLLFALAWDIFGNNYEYTAPYTDD